MKEKEPIYIDASDLKKQEKQETKKSSRSLGRGAIDQFHLIWRLLWDREVPFYLKMIPVAACIYLISPVDFIPDAFLGLGQLDDLGVLLLSGQLFAQLAPQHLVAQHRAEIQGLLPDMAESAESDDLS